MRLWHYELLPYLPKSQLLAQWRELNSIFKKQDKHILINYVYHYEKKDLYHYTLLVLGEMINRNISIHHLENMINYFQLNDEISYQVLPNANRFINLITSNYKPFKNHHNKSYMLICYFNLFEKYKRGQKDFSDNMYDKLYNFVSNQFNGLLDIINDEYL